LLLIGAALVFLLLRVRTAAHDSQLQEQTRTVLLVADVLATELQAEIGRPVHHDPSVTSPFDFSKGVKKNAPGAEGTGVPDDSIEKFVWALWQNQEMRERLKVDVSRVFVKDSDGDGFLELIDGFGNKIAYAAFVKRSADDLYKVDDYLPLSDGVIFMSAGKDGRFGSYAPNDKPDADARDNIRVKRK